MVSLSSVSKIYAQSQIPVVALDGVSFNINDGEFVSVVGRSGAGKTTLVRLLLGEEKPTYGSICFGKWDIACLHPVDLQKFRQKIGVVHQDYRLLASKNVWENLSYIMEVIGVKQESIERDIPQVLEMVGLEKRETNFPSELSGGERQRLAIARALIHRPELVIADEPTGNLDPYNTCEIIEILKRVNSLGTTVLLATHDKEVVNKLKKRVLTLEFGKLVSDEKEGKFIL